MLAVCCGLTIFLSLTVCFVTYRYTDGCRDSDVAIRQPSDYLTLL